MTYAKVNAADPAVATALRRITALYLKRCSSLPAEATTFCRFTSGRINSARYVGLRTRSCRYITANSAKGTLAPHNSEPLSNVFHRGDPNIAAQIATITTDNVPAKANFSPQFLPRP